MTHLRHSRWWIGIVLLAVTGCATTGGGVRGTIAPPATTARPSAAATSTRDAVVYLDRGAAGGRPPRSTRVVRVGRQFEPRVTAVTVGSRVRFENRDETYHSVFSVSPIRRFDTGLFGRTSPKTIDFDRPGIVELRCGIHNHSGYVVVLPHGNFTVPQSNGAFSLGGVSRGVWTIKAWHPVWGTASARVQVDKQPSRASLKFSGATPSSSELP
jgi:plastocyanin